MNYKQLKLIKQQKINKLPSYRLIFPVCYTIFENEPVADMISKNMNIVFELNSEKNFCLDFKNI